MSYVSKSPAEDKPTRGEAFFIITHYYYNVMPFRALAQYLHGFHCMGFDMIRMLKIQIRYAIIRLIINVLSGV